MPIVTLTTDFGNKDHYAGALKGTMLKIFSGLNIVDISHNIQPFDISDAAFVLKNCWATFPEGTVHLVSVNDNDERVVRCIAVEYEKHFFTGFDNGLFSLVFDHAPGAIVELPHPAQNGSLDIYPSKKIFAAAACALAQGKNIADIGRPIAEIRAGNRLAPVALDSLIRGNVIKVDAFQNVIVNVTKDLFGQMKRDRNFSISFRSNRLERDKKIEPISVISESYFDVNPGEMLCRFNSSGYLEIAINSGKAGSLLGLSVGDYVLIEFT